VVINYLDLAMEAGLLNLLSRSMLAFPSDGFIVLTFTAAVRYAGVSAIELTPLAEYLKLPDLSVLAPGASLLYSSDK